MDESDFKNNIETSATSNIYIRSHVLVMKTDINIFSIKLPTRQKSLCKKCRNTEFFQVRILPYSGWIRTQKNSLFRHFLRSE